jgi:transposase
MFVMPKAFPIEFGRDVVAVAREGEAPLSQIAKDFGISESCLHRWLNLADIEDGVRPGVTAAESAELRELKKRHRVLEPPLRGREPFRACPAGLPAVVPQGPQLQTGRLDAVGRAIAAVEPGDDSPPQAQPRIDLTSREQDLR